MRIMSGKQRRFIMSLAEERGVEDVESRFVEGHASMGEASRYITYLLGLRPKRDVVSVDLRGVPSGRYAARVNGVLRFVRVDNVIDGKWAGFIFVKLQSGGSYSMLGSQHPSGKFTRYTGKLREHLRVIAADPKAASVMYGRESGHCGVCGRQLTDEVSLERGIGPVCYERFGSFA